jgi:hypothetical protein
MSAAMKKARPPETSQNTNQTIMQSSPLDEQPDARMSGHKRVPLIPGRGTDINLLWRSLTGRAPQLIKQ